MEEDIRIDIPGFGTVTKDEELGWLFSDYVPVPAFGGTESSLILEGYEDDERKEDFHAAIAAFLAMTPESLQAAEPHVYRYYLDMKTLRAPLEPDFVAIASPGAVWNHARLGCETTVMRGYHDHDRHHVYVSVTCNCDWEPEHGLQIVFRDGNAVCKVGPYDGHLTNADGAGTLEIIYRSILAARGTGTGAG